MYVCNVGDGNDCTGVCHNGCDSYGDCIGDDSLCNACQECEDILGVCIKKTSVVCDEDSDCADCYICDTSVGGSCDCECGVLVTGVTANADTVCVGCEVVFTVTTDPSDECDCVVWEAGGSPSSESTDECTHTVTWDTTGDFIVTATSSCDSQNTFYDDVTIVSIDKIQYNDGQQWNDITDTIYALKDDSVNFKAIPNPPDTSWPSGKPVWSGTSGASGTGETNVVTFNALSSSANDYKTIVVECGNSSITVNVIVFDFTGILTPGDNFLNRSQSNYGLEETVELTCSIDPIGLTVFQLGGLRWKIASGVGTLSNITDYGIADYDAGAYAGDVSLCLEVKSGPSCGEFKPYPKTVIVPSGSYMVKKPLSGIRHEVDTCSCGLLGWSYLNPKNVSFGNIKRREGTCTGTGTGFYAYLNGLVHPTGSWWNISSGNIGTGCRVLIDDEIYSGEKGPPYSQGQFDWPIPREYRADDGVPHEFTTANHNQVADSAGKCTIQKHGTYPLSKNASDPSSMW